MDVASLIQTYGYGALAAGTWSHTFPLRNPKSRGSALCWRLFVLARRLTHRKERQ